MPFGVDRFPNTCSRCLRHPRRFVTNAFRRGPLPEPIFGVPQELIGFTESPMPFGVDRFPN